MALIQIFLLNVTSFCELKSRTVQKHLLNFVMAHTMLALNLVNELP